VLYGFADDGIRRGRRGFRRPRTRNTVVSRLVAPRRIPLQHVRHRHLRHPSRPHGAQHRPAPIEGLSDRIAADVVPDVKLLVSELITNSVKYGGNGEVTLKVEAEDPRKLRVEVIDQGVGFVPVARDRPATDVGGWGLHLVQTLSNRWGVYEGSTHVWFEIDRTSAAA
jgi:Histidine kinase-like ATPase domain